MNQEAFTARLLAAFLEDLEDQLRTLNADLLVLEADPSDITRVQSVFRAIHTLKGAARATGYSVIEQACHALEERLNTARSGTETLTSNDFAILFFAADALKEAGVRLRRNDSLDDAPIAHVIPKLHGKEPLTSTPSITPAQPVSTGAPLVPHTTERAREITFTATAPQETPQPAVQTSDTQPASNSLRDTSLLIEELRTAAPEESVRVRAGKLDALLASSSQLLVGRSRLHRRASQAQHATQIAARLTAQWRREQIHTEAAPYTTGPQNVSAEALKSLQQLAHDVSEIADGLTTDSQTFNDMIVNMFDQVRRVRMRPFSEICDQLARTVRDITTNTGKSAELVIQGGNVEAGRTILDVVRDALLHLVRNAVDHGIETPDVRERAGKPRTGTITVAAQLRGDRLVVTVSDDGAGIDLNAARAAIQRQGLPVPTDDSAILRHLFLSGVSTRTAATEISGRGVGLDAVEASMKRINGTAGIRTTPGHGTTFTLESPLTLATIRALLVSVSTTVIAIPTSYVTQLRRTRADEIRRADGRTMLLTDDRPIPLVSLAKVLGPPLIEKAEHTVPAVVLRSADTEVAMTVDQLLNEDEIVVRPIPRLGTSAPLLTGASILGTGEIAFVINPTALIPAALNLGETIRVSLLDAPTHKHILVVDDSITTRTLEKSTLEAAGYDVTTAVDGADAWRLIQSQSFDLVVSDVEMPRMDGVTLCETVRASKAHMSLPLILVTALETQEQRLRGLEAGADAYIGKSGFDQHTLLDTIRQLVG